MYVSNRFGSSEIGGLIEETSGRPSRAEIGSLSSPTTSERWEGGEQEVKGNNASVWTVGRLLVAFGVLADHWATKPLRVTCWPEPSE